MFYPEDLPATRWFQFYCNHFRTVELNNPFYRLPSFQAFHAWREQSPDGFLFAVKASRYLTHIKRLKDPHEPLERLLDNAAGLGEKLGPLLFQLPPNFGPDLDRLRDLLELRKAADRWTIEFRHAGWFSDAVLELLRASNVALCIQDMTPGCPRVATADFVYTRFHGTHEHDGNYSDSTLHRHSREIEKWLDSGLDVYAYFNNDVGGHAVLNAAFMLKALHAEAPA